MLFNKDLTSIFYLSKNPICFDHALIPFSSPYGLCIIQKKMITLPTKKEALHEIL